MKSKITFECQRCGACCLEYSGLTAHPNDIERWEAEYREDILQYADMFIYAVFGEADLWIHPETGQELYRCPFLRKVRNKPLYRCRIYETRPLSCQGFPHLEYDENGELVGMHSWALEHCPSVKALLKDWTPQQIQTLRDRERERAVAAMQQAPEGPGMHPVRMEQLWYTCTWCEAKWAEGAEIYLIGGVTKRKDMFQDREGQFVPVRLNQAQVIVHAFVLPDDAKEKEQGWDYMFRLCSVECAEYLKEALQQDENATTD
jgi:Fe-S-cluster containining protein